MTDYKPTKRSELTGQMQTTYWEAILRLNKMGMTDACHASTLAVTFNRDVAEVMSDLQRGLPL